DPITRPEIDSVLKHARADALRVGEVSQLQSTHCRRHFRGCDSVVISKPDRERTRSCEIEILEDRHYDMVTYALPLRTCDSRLRSGESAFLSRDSGHVVSHTPRCRHGKNVDRADHLRASALCSTAS